jgi:methylated-DNA-[protein]-cysteine S-methyltransferase
MMHLIMSSPIGTLRLVSEGQSITRIEFPGFEGDDAGEAAPDEPVLIDCAAQLQEYFEGRRSRFDLPLAALGTEFQREVWRALQEIPYGEVCSYGDIARTVGRPKAVRAVGAANGRNPLPIVVPCHRVVGSDGSLTGFAGGLDIKRWLLGREKAQKSLFD